MNFCSDSEMKMTCSFTGYRPNKLSFGDDFTHKDCILLKKALKTEIIGLYEKGIRYFQTGMAMGVDMLCAELVLELKADYPDIALIAVMPCKNQTKGWDEFNLERHQRILSECDGSMLVTHGDYTSGCMIKRNRRLVDTASVLLAVFDGRRGGTMNTVRYADSIGKKIIVIDPYKFVRIELFSKNSHI